MPAHAEIIKNFCCGPCRSKPLILTAKVPKTGYVSGENIIVTVDIDNPTKTLIKEVKISLNLFATYFSQYPRTHTCVEKFPLVRKKTTSLGAESQSSITETIRVPPTPPSCQTYCRIIQLIYELHIETKVGGMHGAPSVAIPITIGNIPLMQAQNAMEQPIMRSLPVPSHLDDFDGEKNSLPIVDPIVNATAPYSPDALGELAFTDSSFITVSLRLVWIRLETYDCSMIRRGESNLSVLRRSWSNR